jgi:hypothetical protein
MKWIGFLGAIALIVACFFPWVFIESKNITVTGINSTGTTFGKPGYFHFVLAGLYLILHFIPRLWAKRFNILVSALNIGWAARNYFLISACSGGECPGKKTALYVVIVSSLIMLVAALLPEVKIAEENSDSK